MSGKRKPSGLIVNVKLPENFKDSLQAEMDDEMKVAQLKWGCRLTEDEIKTIFTHTFNQLQCKIEELGRLYWDLGDIVRIHIKGAHENMELTLSDDVYDTANTLAGQWILCARSWYGLVDEPEDGKKCVRIENFREHIIDSLKQWARTAVFYGVSSHA